MERQARYSSESVRRGTLRGLGQIEFVDDRNQQPNASHPSVDIRDHSISHMTKDQKQYCVDECRIDWSLLYTEAE